MKGWPRRGRVSAKPLFQAVVGPIQTFARLEASSGILLLACAVAALVAVNSGVAESYRAVLDTRLEIGAGGLRARFTVAELVNDGLMTIFFFVVGLEIKRELVVGELRTFRQAMLPLIAATKSATRSQNVRARRNSCSISATLWIFSNAAGVTSWLSAFFRR